MRKVGKTFRLCLFTVLAAAALAGCGGDNKGGSPLQPLAPPGSGGASVPVTPPGQEKFEFLDQGFRSVAGWQIDSTGKGRQSPNAEAGGTELAVASPYEADSAHCSASTVTFLQPGLLKGKKAATIEVTFNSQEFPKNLEYQFRVQAYVGPGRRLISFTPRGIRSFNADASFQVAPTTLTAGDHTVRLVATDDVTGLYLDGKKLGLYSKGYLPGGGNVGDVVIGFEAFEKTPVRNADDCAANPAKIVLKGFRVSANPYFLP